MVVAAAAAVASAVADAAASLVHKRVIVGKRIECQVHCGTQPSADKSRNKQHNTPRQPYPPATRRATFRFATQAAVPPAALRCCNSNNRFSRKRQTCRAKRRAVKPPKSTTMCRCWLRCWEDFYWNCIEEKFCYDETIANYNPEEDEYYQKKPNGNGFLSDNKLENNNSSPVCIQPSMGRSNPRTPNISAGKIHEEDYRQIQTNAPILAPEIMSVFSNSQIFHEHHPVIKKSNFPGVHGKGGREADSEKLLFRLEGNDIVDTASNTTAGRSVTAPPQIDVTDHSLPSSKTFASIREEDGDDDVDNDNDDDGVILRPHLRADSIGAAVLTKSTPILNKQLEKVQSVPHLSSRPVSENDIFSICGSMGMTPEIPSISYTTLPKNYADTPTIEKYRETVSLYSIQSAASARVSQQDLTMPRYFRRTGVSAQSVDNLSMGAGSSGSSGSGLGMGMVFTNPNGGRSTASGAAKTGVEKSKRLKMLRTKLPPLSIHLGGARERSKDKGIE